MGDKVVETLLENDAFRYLSTYSILFACSINSLMPPAPSLMLCRRCGLCRLRNRKINTGWRGRGEMFPRRSKIEFYYQVSQQFCRPLLALSSRPPFVVGRKSLVAAGHMTTFDTNFYVLETAEIM